MSNASYPTTIGGINQWISQYISIDDVRFYNRSLSETEIQELYNEGDSGEVTLDISVKAEPTSGTIPLDTDFTCTVESGTPPYSFSWDFGDGSASILQTPSHTYADPGTYIAEVTVTDGSGQASTHALNIQANELVAQNNLILTSASPNTTIVAGSDTTVYGSTGANFITLESGAMAELFNFPSNNIIKIEADSSLFSVYRSGTVVTFQGSDETILKIPATSDVQTISFTDKTLTLNIYNNQVMLDDQVITTTASAIEDQKGLVACGAYVVPGVWKEFDCYNLAAIGKTTGDDPFTPSWRLIGGYWQWGREGPDASQWYDNNNENFAHGPTGPGDTEANSDSISEWDMTDAPDGSWSDASKKANDPCPAGYRVPTRSEWEGVLDYNTQNTVGTWNSYNTNYTSARWFGNYLILPASGFRYVGKDYVDGHRGRLALRGNSGNYWSSTEIRSGVNAWRLTFTSSYTGTDAVSRRREGLSVRCILE